MPTKNAELGQPRDASGVDISVVVPAYNGDRTIARCLESIERATEGRRREIIVVDSSESEATADIVRRFPNVTLIRSQARLSAGAARNCGIGAACGRLVFFTDQDCIVPRDWIDRFERHFEDPAVGAAGGAIGIQNPSNWSGCALYFLEFLNHFPVNEKARRNSNFLVGSNCCVRASVLRTIRFPDQTLGEDILFSNSLRQHDVQIVYDPATAALHENRAGWVVFFNYNYKMGRAAASYHQQLRLWWAAPALRAPILAFSAPLVVLPSISLSLLRAPWSYLFRFLLLSRMCLLGNLMWANGFRKQVLERGERSRDTVQ
jgi:GT2 family glycosyltransferase